VEEIQETGTEAREDSDNKPMILSASILSADFGNLQRDIELLNNSAVDWIHVDVMDGVFVPNISYGFPVMKILQEKAHKPLDAHLMIIDPDRYVQRFAESGANILTVHYEACSHLHRTIQYIKANNMKAGVSVNPHTPVSVLYDILEEADLILIMSVNPGFAAQKFIKRTYNKISQLKEYLEKNNLKTIIQVDGGVNLENAPELISLGCDSLVAGNSIFNTPDPVETIRKFKTLN
jgi:ribulose-phosphate 3-epimerase